MIFTISQDKYQLPVCIHCGATIPDNLAKHDFQYCCKGCETAYQILESLKEESLTTKLELKPAPPENLVTIELSPTGQVGSSTCSITKPERTRTFEEMDDPVFQRKYVTAINEQQSRVTLILEGMHCASCVNLIEKLPRLLPGVISAHVNLSRNIGTFIYHHQRVSLSEIACELEELGYRPHAYLITSAEINARQQSRHELIQLAIAGFCAGNTMLIAIALYAGVFTGMEAGHLALFRYVSAILALIAVLGPGMVFFKNAWRALSMRSPHMDLPVALGIGIGTIDGVYRTITNSGEIYFDSISSLVFLLLVGRFLQSQQKRQTLDRVSLLRALTPQTARRISGAEKKLVPAEALLINDLLEVQAGESFPADGMILEGQALIDQGLLTGESMPVPCKKGDQVIAGTTNLSSTLTVKVTAIGYETRLGKLLRMMDEAVVHKSPLVQFADRIGGKFIITVLILAAINMLIWWSQGSAKAIEQTIALLVVSCPCALGLATPLVIAVLQGRAAQRGILIKSGDAVERLAGSGEIWLDKTGTVTSGKMKLLKWIGDASVKPAVQEIEVQVQHPIAQALALALKTEHTTSGTLKVSQLVTTQGKGVSAVVNGDSYFIGSASWFTEHQIEIPKDIQDCITQFAQEGWTSILISRNGYYAALAVLGDVIRPGTEQLILELETIGWKVGMLSGDNQGVVEQIAGRVGIHADRRLGESSPEMKLAHVSRKLQHHHIVMVGDGVNDAAALMAADVGIAVHGGAEASLHAADIYLSKGDITQLSQLIAATKNAMRRIYINFGFSITYNIISITLAMTGYIHPLLAALLMPVSSITVLTVALWGGLFPKSNHIEVPK